MTDGRSLCLRPLNHKDAPLLEAGIIALSDRSRYFRFFSGFKQAPPSVLKRLTEFHGNDHLAWGAVDSSLDDMPPIAAAHIIRVDDSPPISGDFAIAILDDYHHQGIARALIACLFSDAVSKGFQSVELDVLSENRDGISLFRSLGAQTVSAGAGIKHMKIDLSTALNSLQSSNKPTLMRVFQQFP
jgi:ribosomal protein S18 acetylase RimI-like enzyme